MKKSIGFACVAMIGLTAGAVEPMRVALLDFQDDTGARPEAALGGAIAPAALAQKGAYFLGKSLLQDVSFTVIDQREFIDQITKDRQDGPRVSFLRAAQALRAVVVVRGRLQAFSVGKKTVNQGGYSTEFAQVSVRVALEALDTKDGAVIALADGRGTEQVRQTAAHSTTLGEEEVTQLFEKAIAEAVPSLKTALQARMKQQTQREMVKVTITSSADPALVEIDGLLVGSTPLEEFEIYKGDHVLTVGKAGYRDVSKRILIGQDSRIEVPMIRTELSAEEMKEVLEKARLHIFLGEPALTILPLE